MRGKISWMNQNGDTLAIYDTEIDTSTDEALTVKDAEEFLRDHRAQHRIVYNTRDKVITDQFDPTAGNYVVMPRMGGGQE